MARSRRTSPAAAAPERRTPRRRVTIAVTALALLGGACSSTNTGPSGQAGQGPAGSAPAGATVDYASLGGTLDGSGATFPKAFYEDSIEAFKEVAPEVTVNYGGGGSGKGKKDLADSVTDWAGSDSEVKAEEKSTFKGGAFLYFPTVAAPITVSYNLSGVAKLQLAPATLARIFSAQITSWNDAAIAADNPGVTLPSKPIVVVHRSDGSGTTSNFTRYLAAAAGDAWSLGAGDTVSWPVTTQAGNGNAGVAQIVKATDGAIGYVDLSDAKASGLTFASVKNRSGAYVAPTLAAASAAVANAKVDDDLTYDALDPAGADAYPITASTYLIVYSVQPDRATGQALRGWINFVLTEGQTLAEGADFARLPDALQKRAVAQLDQLKIG